MITQSARLCTWDTVTNLEYEFSHRRLCVVRKPVELTDPFRDDVRITPVNGHAKSIAKLDTGHDVLNGDLGVHLGDGGEKREVCLAHERCHIQFLKRKAIGSAIVEHVIADTEGSYLTGDVEERSISNQNLLGRIDLLNEVLHVSLDDMLNHGRKGAEETDKVGDLVLHLNECAYALNENLLDAFLQVAYTMISC